MRTIRPRLWGVLAIAAMMPLAADASATATSTGTDAWSPFPVTPSGQQSLSVTAATSKTLTLLPQGTSISNERAATPTELRHAPAPRRNIASPADLAGQKVMTTRSLTSNLGDDGNSCTATYNATDQLLTITGFYNDAITLSAKVDVASSTITIANQVVGQMQDNGDIDIAFCKPDGKPDRSKPVTGKILPDGTIEIADWWGIYVVAGTNKDRAAYLGNETVIRPANASMSFNFSDGRKVKFNVYVTQPYDNRVLITNFGNYGMTVYADLDSRRGGKIPSQVARQYPANNANFVTCGVGSYDNVGNPQNITANITLTPAPAGDNATLRWGNWTAISQGTQNMYFGAITNGLVEYQGSFSYPKEVTGKLDGDGSQASPYLIRTLNDLQILANSVNSVPESEYNAFLNGVDCARVHEGKHFRLENDIDMGSILFTPVGADAYHYFAGTFDGQNHTISNLSVSSTTGLAALFGLVDEKGTVKNLKLANPKVESSGQTAGTVAGWCFGTLDNCHVTGANVVNYARIAGGLVGVGHIVTNCTVKDSHILGANGNPAGMAGQVDKLMENCHVSNTTVLGATGQAGLPAGGVVAALTNARGSNLSFSGLVDTRKYQCTMSAGGVVGVLSNATLEKSFATGEVRGGMTDNYGRKSAAGGVVGKTYGSLIENCYFTGSVSTYLSRTTGGITGWLTPDVQGTDTISTTVRNCWSAALVTSETYLYDKENEARETIGWIENSTPVLENLYYDNQLTNLNSTRFGASTADLTSATGPQGFDASVWQYTAGQYPRLKASADTPNALMSASAIVLPARSSLKKVSGNGELHPLGGVKYLMHLNGTLGDKGHFSSIEGNAIKISDQFGTDTLRVVLGDIAYDLEMRVAPVSFDGEGTASNPFLIRTKEDMVQLSKITSEKQQTFPGDHFLMTNDIDMSGADGFLGICGDATIATGTYNKFAGVFDGGNHSVRNLKLDWIEWTTRPEASADGLGTPDSKNCLGVRGLFGKLAPEGVIRNVVIDKSCSFWFWARSGAIVGQNEGLVENCRNHGELRTASQIAAGIVGENRKGTVRRCYNDGTIITGAGVAGGIVGTGNGRLEECVNAGDIKPMVWTTFNTSTKKFTACGGIQGENKGSDMFNCVNYGHVSGYNKLGGISGELGAVTSTSVLGRNELHSVINVGTISYEDPTSVGALAGTSGTTGTVEHTHWDRQIITEAAHGGLALKGAKGLFTSVLTSSKPLEGFDTSVWDFAAGKYPALSWCLDEPVVQHARALVANINAPHTAADFHGSASLTGLDGASWKLDDNSRYAINGSVLTAPVSVTEKITGQLTGTSGDYTRVIPLASVLALNLQGNGTEETPYLISNADDWNTLADYVTANGAGFEDAFLKVTADIDFNGKSFKPLFIGNNTFMGELDGAGFTVKNVAYTTNNTYQAAIGCIDLTGVVRNLKIQGAVTSAKANTGGFSAKVYGTVENCENLVNVTATSGSGHSGFGNVYGDARLVNVTNRATVKGSSGQVAGISHNVAEGAYFEKVVNYGTVGSTSTGTAFSNFGGIAATCYPATFIDCRNEGKFEFGNPSGAQQVGGIIGNANATATARRHMVITRCSNLADINGKAALAGIVANMSNQNCVLEITDCRNDGNIASVSTASGTGAISGITSFHTPGSVIRGCDNHGNISSVKTVYASGIVGGYKGMGNQNLPTLVADCHNYGSIEAKGNQGGGIAAQANNFMTIDSCSNHGKVTGGFGLGGIIAQLGSNDVRIAHCYNEADIESTVYRAGGLIGWGNNESVVEECFNTGNVSSTSTVQGTSATSANSIGGLAGYSGCTFIRCYNTGSVKGLSQVGGLVGQTFKNRTKLYDCYNAGQVIAPADSCGSLVGVKTIGNGSYWNADNVAENCHYVAQTEKPANDAIGSELTLAALCKLAKGEGWDNGDDYSLPMLRNTDCDAARLWSVALIPADGDTYPNITKSFHVGNRAGVTWTADIAKLHFDGNDALFNGEEYKGSVTLTAAIGDRKREFILNADIPSGIDAIGSDNNVVGRVWFTTDGIRTAEPAKGESGVFIVVTKYADGSEKTAKVTIK